MHLVETIRATHGNAVIRNLAQRFGIDEAQTERTLFALIPEIARAMRRGAKTRTGAPAVHAGAQDERFARYLDDPATLLEPKAEEDGRLALGEVFTSDSEAQEAVQNAATKSSVDAATAERMLPAASALALSALHKELHGTEGTSPIAPGHFGVQPEDEAGDPLSRALASIFGDDDVSITRKP